MKRIKFEWRLLYGCHAETTVYYFLMTGMANCDVGDWASPVVNRSMIFVDDWDGTHN
jgi:hypothetical protein